MANEATSTTAPEQGQSDVENNNDEARSSGSHSGGTDEAISSAAAEVEREALGQGAKAPKKSEAPPAQTQAPTKHKVTIDGVTSEVTTEALIKGYQLEATSRKRLQEGATYKRSHDLLQNTVQQIKTNPESVFELVNSLGGNADQLAIARVKQLLALEAMSPVERRAHDAEQKLKQFEAQDAKTKEQQKQQETQQQKQARAQQTEGQIVQFFQQQNERPSPDVVELMLQHLIQSYQRPEGPISMADAYTRAKSGYAQRQTNWKKTLTVDDLTPELIEAARKKDLANLGTGFTQKRKPDDQAAQVRNPKARPSTDEWFKQLDDRFN